MSVASVIFWSQNNTGETVVHEKEREDEDEEENIKQETSKNEQKEDEPPAEFLCPITRELMQDPVCTSDGHTYERSISTKLSKCNYVEIRMRVTRLFVYYVLRIPARIVQLLLLSLFF